MSDLATRVATVFGIGYLPTGPGTWASAVTIPLAWGLHWTGGFWLMAAAAAAITVAGFWATSRYIDGRADKDPSEIVVDEVAGMLIALLPFSFMLGQAGVAPQVFPWPGWVLGFLIFRFFDIVKPPPVGWADRLPGTLGVMLDDLLAGLLTGVVSLLAAGMAHGWF